jgi:hypothetical protein
MGGLPGSHWSVACPPIGRWPALPLAASVTRSYPQNLEHPVSVLGVEWRRGWQVAVLVISNSSYRSAGAAAHCTALHCTAQVLAALIRRFPVEKA